MLCAPGTVDLHFLVHLKIYIYTYIFFEDLCTRHNFCSLNSQYVRHVAKEQRDYKKEAEKSSSLTF